MFGLGTYSSFVFWNDDMFDCVDAAVRRFDHFVKGDERCLKTKDVRIHVFFLVSYLAMSTSS